jgi:hypothetical protein
MEMVKALVISKKKFWYGGIVWVLLWLLPWGELVSYEGNLCLIFLVDMTKLAIAIAMFIIPGALLYLLLRQKDNPMTDDPIGILSVGFALSVSIIALIGITGRLLGLSFALVKTFYAILGLGELLALVILGKDRTVRRENFIGIFRNILGNIPLTMALVLSGLMTINDHLFFIDDFTYLAYLTNWQRSVGLNFNNLIHQMDVLEIERFWLALYPMGQALMSDLSGVPGSLLFSNYLEVFLLLLAVLTSYWFSRSLGLSSRAAGFSTLIQTSLYTWMIGENWPVGFWYYFNMAEDKVSAVFLLSPVFFFFVLNFVQRPSLKNFILVVLGGVGLTLTHPVILFFACLISAGLGMLAWVVKKTGWREIILLAVVVVFVVSPYVAIRFYNYSASAGFSMDAKSVGASYQAERYTRVLGDIFYGLNPEVLLFFNPPPEVGGSNIFQIFRAFPFLLTSLAGVLALINLRKGPFYWYISVCVVLVALATIPYTGWILGFFSDARLISRVSWFSPLGLAGVLVLFPLSGWFKTSPFARRIEKNYSHKLKNGSFIGVTMCLLFASPMLLIGSVSRMPNYFKMLDHVRQLAHIGVFIDQNSIPPVTSIAIDYMDIQMLPGVSAHTSIISYREEKDDNGHNFFFSTEEIHHRMYASNTIRSLKTTVPCEERRSLMEEFDVQYVVSPAKDMESFVNIIEGCGIPIELKYRTVDLTLLKVR